MSSTTTRAAADPEQLFLASLPLVDRILAIQTRRHALPPAEADDFAAWAKARLIDRDYAILRKFGGRSALATYLTVVLANLFRDWRNSRWGRWRPSAAARRAGPLAIRLEELLYRDGHPLREATEILRSAHAGLDESVLVHLAARLPQRAPAGELSLDARTPAVQGLVSPADSLEDDDATRAVEGALRDAVADLPPEDAVIVRMRFWGDVSVADIARTLQLDQKRLYSRIDGIKARLRAALEARGVDRALASEVLVADDR